MPIFRRLRIAEIVDRHCPGKEEVSHGMTVVILGLNRLMSPQPLYRVQEWMTETVLEDTLGISAEQMYDVRLGRTLDDLHPYLDAIWQDIVVQAILEYHLDLTSLHYDITSLYFEGEYADSAKIDYGYSRDHRPDTKQVNLGVNVTGPEGVPLAYRVLAGRTADQTTPVENMRALQGLLNRPELAQRDMNPIVISDRAMLRPEVIATYDREQIRWLGPLNLDEPLRTLLGSVENDKLDAHPLDYRPVNQPKEEPLRYHGVRRSTVIEHEGQRVPIQALVVKSRTKLKLDRERRQTYLERLTARLDEINGMLNKRRYKRRAYAQTQIDKARRGNPAKRFVNIELSGEDGQLKLHYSLDQELLAQAKAVDGRYLLGTNKATLSACQMLTLFKQQEVVERRFKVIKGPVRIRPLFLHKEERVESLVFVAMLALLVYTILEILCRRVGEQTTARRVLQQFERLAATYIQFDDGSQLKLPSALNTDQQQLIDLLRFPPPEVYLRPQEAIS
jgi:transposase